jgi:putative FmdB family regulatory protein
MPLYTYRCNDCDHSFEARQRMSEDPLTDCPVCPGEVRRVINSVGVVFKGNGFYVTDTRNGRSANGVNGAASSNGVSSDAASEKPAATAADKSKDKTESKSKVKADTKTAVQPAA